MSESIFVCQNISKSYHDGTGTIEVLKHVNLRINSGERIAIIGPSGSGKSTLLHLLGGLDNPSDGELFMNGLNWRILSEKQRCSLRNKHLGFVYQFHHLLPEFTALENVAMPILLSSSSVAVAEARAEDVLKQVGLAHRLEHKPSQLSGGERQRVAIARALVNRPSCLLADEPTGNLDNATASKIFELILELNEQFNTALVVVTHDQHLASGMDKVLMIQDGFLSTG